MFNCVVGREEQCKQISLACVGSACSVWATLGLPALTACVLSQSTLLRLQVILQGNCLRWALSLVHFLGLSRSGTVSRVLHKGTDSVEPEFCPCVLCPSQVRAAQVTRCLVTAHSPGALHLITTPVPATQYPGCAAASHVCHVSLLGS